MKKIDKDKIRVLVETNQSLKGTAFWGRYHMYHESRMPDGKWIYIGFGYPLVSLDYISRCYIKGIKGITWLYVETRNDIERYLLTDHVVELLQLGVQA